MTKGELINKLQVIIKEAYHYWAVMDGLASRENIEAEQKRIKEDGNTIIEYIKNHC